MNQKPEGVSASDVAAQRSDTPQKTPPPAVLSDLRRLWGKTTTAITATTPKQRPSGLVESPRCPLDHRNPDGWRWTPDRSRPGYRRAACGFCGRFYGYAPPEGEKRARRC
jgi:hypothetical protein